MHQLVCALVHAPDEKQALREAYRVFSMHTCPTSYDEEGHLCQMCRYDYFVMFDVQSAINLRQSINSMFRNSEFYKLKGFDEAGKPIKEEIPLAEDYQPDYTSIFPARHYWYTLIESTEEVPMPAVLPANDPNALKILDIAMKQVEEETYKLLSELRILLKSKSDEQLFNEPGKFHYLNRLGLNNLTHHLEKLWKHLDYVVQLYDHRGCRIRTKGRLKSILKGEIKQYLYDENGQIVYREVYREELKDRIGRGFAYEYVTVNHLSLWVVPADAHS